MPTAPTSMRRSPNPKTPTLTPQSQAALRRELALWQGEPAALGALGGAEELARWQRRWRRHWGACGQRSCRCVIIPVQLGREMLGQGSCPAAGAGGGYVHGVHNCIT